MSWIPVWLLLLAQCAALGTTVHLTCTLSRDHSVGLHSIFWYQQRPGHPPRFLLRYFSHSNQGHGPGIPPRFSGSKDVARNSGYLIISELRPEDEAVYYCAMGSLEEEMERKRGEEKEPAASGSQVLKDSVP